MVVEKQKLDNKVVEMKERVQVADQSINNLEDLQDKCDFKANTLKSRGQIHSSGNLFVTTERNYYGNGYQRY
ncbi:hypothetical protein ABVT39_016032 [Epinephelus coioides]